MIEALFSLLSGLFPPVFCALVGYMVCGCFIYAPSAPIAAFLYFISALRVPATEEIICGACNGSYFQYLFKLVKSLLFATAVALASHWVLTTLLEWDDVICVFLAYLLAVAGWGTLLAIYFPMTVRLPGGREENPLMDREQAQAKAAGQRAKTPDGATLTFGGVALLRAAANLGWLIMGRIGGGKTLTARLLAQQALGEMATSLTFINALFFDGKNEWLPLLRGIVPDGDVALLSAGDARTDAWDLAADFQTSSDALLLAGILSPETTTGDAAIYAQAARDVFAGIIETLQQIEPDWGLGHICRIASMKAESQRAFLMQSPAGRRRLHYFPENRKNGLDLGPTLRNAVAPFETVAAAFEKAPRKISIRAWATTRQVLVLGSDQKNRVAADAINKIALKMAIQTLLAQKQLRRGEPGREHWLFLDEIRELGDTSQILRPLALLGRSVGCCPVYIMQDRDGWISAFNNQRAAADELLSQPVHVGIFGVQNGETQKYWSGRFGAYDKYRETRSVGVSHKGLDETTISEGIHESVQDANVVDPAEFANMPLTNAENGLTGFYSVVGLGCWQATLTGDELKAQLVEPDASDEFVPRTDNPQLTEWTAADYRRLHIPLGPEDAAFEDATDSGVRADTDSPDAAAQTSEEGPAGSVDPPLADTPRPDGAKRQSLQDFFNRVRQSGVPPSEGARKNTRRTKQDRAPKDNPGDKEGQPDA